MTARSLVDPQVVRTILRTPQKVFFPRRTENPEKQYSWHQVGPERSRDKKKLIKGG